MLVYTFFFFSAWIPQCVFVWKQLHLQSELSPRQKVGHFDLRPRTFFLSPVIIGNYKQAEQLCEAETTREQGLRRALHSTTVSR